MHNDMPDEQYDPQQPAYDEVELSDDGALAIDPEDFSADFPAATFERLRARSDDEEAQDESLNEEDEDIGSVWQDLQEITHMEAIRQKAQEAFTKSLPVGRRAMFKLANVLQAAATKPDEETPPMAETQTPPPLQPVSSQTNATALPVAVQPQAPVISDIKTVEIKVSLPTLPKLPSLPSRATMLDQAKYIVRTYRKYVIIAASIAAVAVIGSVVYFAVHIGFSNDPSLSEDPTNNATGKPDPKTDLKKGAPGYATLLPVGKDIKSLGGWTRVSPPDREAVYAYVDKIDDVTIDVSEQPIPKAMQADTANKVSQMALSFKATKKVHAGKTILYIGQDANGTQSIILTRDKLLILIKTAAPISSDQAIDYVNSLQ